MLLVCACVFCSGLVPLHNACSYGHYEVTQLLIEVFDMLICHHVLIMLPVCIFKYFFCSEKICRRSCLYVIRNQCGSLRPV